MKTKYLLVIMMIQLSASNTVYAQRGDILDKLNEKAAKLRVFMTNVALFNRSFRMGAEEFNKTVKVVKGDGRDRSKEVPRDKITPLEIKKGEIKNMEWKTFAGFEDQLFPSAIIGLSVFKGPTTPEMEAIIRPIGIRFISKYENIPIKYEIECSDKKFFDKVTGDYLYDNIRQQVLVNPVIPWNYEALAKVEASTPVTFTFRLYDEKGNKAEKSVSTYFRSVNDCLLGYGKTPLYFLSLAYIQEEHPAIEKILKEATNTKIVSKITGYQLGKNEVDLQVAAVCRVLHDRGFNYSSITTTVGDGKYTSSQVVRTFQNSIATNQANCIDGTVVFASILRKMDIATVMVITNNHCFLGYYRQRDDRGNCSDLVYLETVRLADADKIEAAMQKAKTVSDPVKAQRIINQGYIEQYHYLLDQGNSTFNYYNSGKDGSYVAALINVDKERVRVKPIPFTAE